MRYDAVLFDNDGVLTTPTRLEALTGAIETAFERVGVTDAPTEHVESLISPSVETLRSVAAAADVDPAQLWRARERAAITTQRREIRAGRKRLYDDVGELAALSVPRGIVSNNQQATIDTIVSHFGLDGFSPSYGREPTVAGIRRKKPRPYYLERAIAEVGADRPVYVGDSGVDVRAATALGIDSVFVRRPHRRDHEPPTPTHEIDSLADLPAVL